MGSWPADDQSAIEVIQNVSKSNNQTPGIHLVVKNIKSFQTSFFPLNEKKIQENDMQAPTKNVNLFPNY